MYLYNVIVSLANLNLCVIKGDKGWGNFETVMKDLCVKCSQSSWKKFLKKGSSREQSVGPLLPFLSAWESTCALSSSLGVRLNLGLSQVKVPFWGVRAGVGLRPGHSTLEALALKPRFLALWLMPFRLPLTQPTPLIFYISAMASVVSSSRPSWPLAVALSWPSPLLSIFQKELSAYRAHCSTLQVPVAPNTEDWRPYVATRVFYTLTPNLLSRIISFPPLVPDPLVTLKFLLQWGSPISAVGSGCFFCQQALLPFSPGEILQSKYHLAPAKSCWSPTPTLAGSCPSPAPLWLRSCVTALCAPPPVPMSN